MPEEVEVEVETQVVIVENQLVEMVVVETQEVHPVSQMVL
jgi:hypothetical protein